MIASQFFSEGDNSPLRLLLQALTGCVSHRGQAPASKRRRRERAERLAQLKLSLKEAVLTEAYEDAAMLRDEIRALENTDETGTSVPVSLPTDMTVHQSTAESDINVSMPIGAGRGC